MANCILRNEFLLEFWREKCSLTQLQSMENFKQAADVWQKVYLGCKSKWGCIVLAVKSKTQGKEITLGQPKRNCSRYSF